jgi:hypothetical protein
LLRRFWPHPRTGPEGKGVEWAITLDIAPDELVGVIQDATSGHLEDDSNVGQEWDSADFLGAAAGLSPRGSRVLQLVVLVHSN